MALIILFGVAQLLGAIALWVTLPAWVNAKPKPDEYPDMNLIERGLGNLAGYVVIGLLAFGFLGCVLTVMQ